MQVRLLPCTPANRVKLVQKSPALGTRRPRGRTSHPDQSPLSSSGRTADSNPASGGSIPSRGAKFGELTVEATAAPAKRPVPSGM